MKRGGITVVAVVVLTVATCLFLGTLNEPALEAADIFVIALVWIVICVGVQWMFALLKRRRGNGE